MISKIEFQRFDCKADVGFLIDGSLSITDERYGGIKHNWNLIKDFILVLAKDINITEDGAHFAVGVFSTIATLDIKFSDFTDYPSFEKAVIELRHPAEVSDELIHTDTLRGYDLAFNQMFDESTGMRSDVRKTLIFLTDGQCARGCEFNAAEANDNTCRGGKCKSNYCQKLYVECDRNSFPQWGNRFRNREITTIGIGVGLSTKEQEIIDFVGQSNYYKKKSFNLILTKRFRRSLLFCEGKLVTQIFPKKNQSRIYAYFNILFVS